MPMIATAGRVSQSMPTISSADRIVSPVTNGRMCCLNVSANQPPTQHAGGRAQHVGGQRGRGDLQLDALEGVQHGHQPGLHAAAGHGAQHEEHEEQDHGAGGEQVPSGHLRRAMGRLAHLVVQDAALQQDRQHDRNAEQTDGQQRAAPADQQPSGTRRPAARRKSPGCR